MCMAVSIRGHDADNALAAFVRRASLFSFETGEYCTLLLTDFEGGSLVGEA
jgi:hypothetical protein